MSQLKLVDPTDPRVAIGRCWLAAFNNRDLDGLLELYTEDAVHTSPKLRDRRPETGGEVRGKVALRAWWADCFARLPHLRYEERRIAVGEGVLMLVYLRTHPGEPDLLVAESYDLREGKICASHVFHG